jgi:hypothetical protein
MTTSAILDRKETSMSSERLDDLYTIDGFAKAINITECAVRNHVKRGSLSVVRHPRAKRIYIPRSAALAFAQARGLELR